MGAALRTHSVLDIEQQLFGPPKRFFQWTLQLKWHLDFVHPSLDKANHQICALNILRGELYVSFPKNISSGKILKRYAAGCGVTAP